MNCYLGRISQLMEFNKPIGLVRGNTDQGRDNNIIN